MQIFTILLALMVSSVLAGPIGRYRNPGLKPRHAQQGAPYANSTSFISTPTPTSNAPGGFMVILPSTSSTLSQPFSSAVTQPRSFQNIADGPTTSAASNVASVITVTTTKIVEPPTTTTDVQSTSSIASEVTSSTSRRSFQNVGDTPPPTSSATVPSKTIATSLTITSSTSDAVVTPSTSLPVISSSTTISSVAASSTSDAVVTPPSSTLAPTNGGPQPSSALFSSVRFPVGTNKPITSAVPITTSTAITAPGTTTTSVAPTAPAGITTPVTSGPVATSVATTDVQPTITTSAGPYPSASTVPGNGTSGDTGDKFGNKELAIAQNKKFAALTASSKCDPNDPTTQNVCIGGVWAYCNSGGTYTTTPACSLPLKCLSTPLELSAGTSVGCITPDDAAFKMGLANAAALESLIGGGGSGGAPTGLTPREVATAVTLVPAEATATMTPPPQEPVLPLPISLLVPARIRRFLALRG